MTDATPPAAAEPHPGREAARGTVSVYLAEAVALPTGLAVVSFLTHRLGPARYGQYALAVSVVTWLEVTLVALLSRASVRLVADARDWRPVASAVLRLHLAVGLPVAAAFWLLAGRIAEVLQDPAMAAYLRLFAIDLPLFLLTRAHRQVLVGLGEFHRRAWTSAGRWTSRLVLILILVELGLGVNGALLGGIGATLVELALARLFVRPRLAEPGFAVGRLLGGAWTLIVCGVALRAFGRLDLFFVKSLDGDPVAVGCYAAAQNLTLPLGLFALTLSPVLLSTLSRAFRDGAVEAGRRLGRNALRLAVLLLPLAALAAGAADDIADLLLAHGFAPAGPLLRRLVLAAACSVLFSVSESVLVSLGRYALALSLALPVLALAVLGYVLLIPGEGATGAAGVTLAVTAGGALAGLLLLHRVSDIAAPRGTWLRAVPIGAAAGLLARLGPAPGPWVVAKLGLLGLLVVLALVLAGELSAGERARLRRWRRREG